MGCRTFSTCPLTLQSRESGLIWYCLFLFSWWLLIFWWLSFRWTWLFASFFLPGIYFLQTLNWLGCGAACSDLQAVERLITVPSLTLFPSIITFDLSTSPLPYFSAFPACRAKCTVGGPKNAWCEYHHWMLSWIYLQRASPRLMREGRGFVYEWIPLYSQRNLGTCSSLPEISQVPGLGCICLLPRFPSRAALEEVERWFSQLSDWVPHH